MYQLIEMKSLVAPEISVEGLTTIGRDRANNVVVEDEAVAERHARLEQKAGGIYVRDLHSQSGTFVNCSQIIEAKLNHGDILRVGNREWRFVEKSGDSDELLQLSSRNSVWNEQLENLPNVALSEMPVLIHGESGTGKEVLAKAIHANSMRRQGPFIALNCSALSTSLIESELFGHIKGAFTDASVDRKGAFEAAHRGTLFLDEIGDLPLSLQPKLLRALESGEIKPVGSDKTRMVDVRVIAATHQDLNRQIQTGEFRTDLFFRLNVLRLTTPALKDRLEDFETLLYSFCKLYRVSFSQPAILELKRHSWPGNVRELKNVVARASALFPRGRVEVEHIPLLVERIGDIDIEHLHDRGEPPRIRSIREVEKEMIVTRLIANNGNQRLTAQELGLPKSTLHDRLKIYGINVRELRKR